MCHQKIKKFWFPCVCVFKNDHHTCNNLLTGQHHDGGKTSSKDETLSPVQESQTCVGFHRSILVLGQIGVVSLSFVLLVVKILTKQKTYIYFLNVNTCMTF